MTFPFDNLPWQRALPAFLVEAAFYLSLGSEKFRARLERLPAPAIALTLTVSAVIPYFLAAKAFGTFAWTALGWIALLAGAASFWYILLPKAAAADLLLLIFMAAVWIAAVFKQWYVCPYPKLYLPVLGQLMWFRTGLFSMLSIRRMQGVGFGFWPNAREWGIGAAHFAIFAPVAAVVAHFIHFASPHWPASGWEKTSLSAVGTFFGILWVVALAEEFFFRGLLQQWLDSWTGSRAAGLILASILFGSVHLFYRAFPNWKLAVLASIAGVAYGLAFRRAKSIRASMVAHALVVTAWKMFF